MTLTGANTHTGATTASGGTLAVAGAIGAVATSPVTVNNAATLPRRQHHQQQRTA